MVLLTTPGTGDGPFGLFALIYLVVICIVLLPTYVLNALPLFFIARRRGLQHAWLAWVPVGGSYVLGSISDDYQLLCRNELKNRRLWLPLLYGLFALAYIVGFVLVFVALALYPAGQDVTVHPPVDSIGAMVAMLFVLLAGTGCSIAAAVIKWMATYDLFRSCEPYRAGTYLGICIAVQFLLPNFAIIRQILMLVVCKKDLGMPVLEQPKQDQKMPDPAQPRKEPWDI